MNQYLLHSDDLAFGQITRAFLVQPGGGRTRTGYAGTQTHPPTAPGFPSETRGVLKVANIDSYLVNTYIEDIRSAIFLSFSSIEYSSVLAQRKTPLSQATCKLETVQPSPRFNESSTIESAANFVGQTGKRRVCLNGCEAGVSSPAAVWTRNSRGIQSRSGWIA